MRKIISTNPGQGYEPIGAIEVTSPEAIAQAVTTAHAAKRMWKQLGVQGRIAILHRVYTRFLEQRTALQDLIVQEVGKTVSFAARSYQRFLDDFAWFLDNGPQALQAEITYEDETAMHRIVYEPYGVAAVIAPWNHPFGMFVWGAIPNLIAGNTVVFKHSEECILSGQFIDQVVQGIDVPAGVFQQIYGDGEQGRVLLEQDINLIWFTGSTAVGQAIYQQAGKKFIKAVMEAGGSNPGIVFADSLLADDGVGNSEVSQETLDRLVQKLYKKRFDGCGQGCDALKRLLIEDSIVDLVIPPLTKAIESRIVGPNTDPQTEIGSLCARRQLEILEEQVADAIARGATVVTGGHRPEHLDGAYYLPTVLTNVSHQMRVWSEEVFGPVLAVRTFKTEAEALEMANHTQYGLGALVFTQDKHRAERVAQSLDVGSVEINNVSHWLPCNPFGGYKKSGMGREHGPQGFRELCQIKLISTEK